MEIRRGDVVLVDLEPVKGSEQGGIRPCLIIQNNNGNLYSPLTIIAPFTTKNFIKEFPTNVFLSGEESGLKKDSTLLLNQIKAIDRKRIRKKIFSLNSYIMQKVDNALRISLDLR